ncbi:MAG: CPBP family intramembrane glutamic endopeptidase [Candidatus Bathyarchaeia archaeon]
MRDGGKWLEPSHLVFALISAIYLFSLIVFYPPKEGVRYEGFYKVFLEELFFRLSLLGILWSKLDLLKKPFRTVIVVIFNGILFSALHVQYTLVKDYATVSMLGINYAAILLEIGIIPTIVAHLIWNIYHPNLLLQVPLIFMNLSWLFYRHKREVNRERGGKIRPPI